MDDTRCKKGEERLRQMKYANSIGPKLAEISPELNCYRKEFAFGDVHSREGLSARDHELIIISGLCALGYAAEELRSHINLGLNAGLSRQEILEIFIQLAVYAGFPAAVNATFIAKEVFDARDAKGIKP